MNNYLTREDEAIFCLAFTHNYSNWLKRMGKRRDLQSNSNKNIYHKIRNMLSAKFYSEALTHLILFNCKSYIVGNHYK